MSEGLTWPTRGHNDRGFLPRYKHGTTFIERGPRGGRVLLPKETMIYKSSRFTSGNRIFRTSLDVEGHQITYRKGRWLGSTEETINVDHISSVRAQHGVMFSSITIESSGGSQPIVIQGLHKSDARDIENAIRATQGPDRQTP